MATAETDTRNGTEDGGVRSRLLARLPIEDRRLDLAGIPTAVLEGGSGRPLVLLHGQGEFAATWARVIPELARRYHVIAPDLPGHGASGTGEERLDAHRIVAWLHALVTRTCDEPPIVAGHLLGGAIALRAAIAAPERANRLVLVDSLGLTWFRPAPRFAIPMVRFIARPTERSRDRLFDQCFLDRDALHDDLGGQMALLEAYALERARTPEVKAALQGLMPRVGLPPVPADDLARLTVPTSMIWGRDDLQVAVRHAEAASARYGWPLHVIEGARDDPAVERPAEFLDAFQRAVTSPEAAR